MEKDIQEIIIQKDKLWDLIHGIGEIDAGINKIQHKLKDSEAKEIMVPLLATLITIVRMFPLSERNRMIKIIEQALDIELPKSL